MVMKIKRELVLEVAIRGLLWLIFMWLDNMDPFIRVIQPEEMWLYKYPLTKSYVPSSSLWPIVFGVPLTCFGVHYIYHKCLIELQEELLGLTLNFGVSGVVMQYLKVIVGRPRPDFYYRCFPEGNGDGDPTDCTGERWRIMDGRKSFPSGHSTFAFASLVYTSLYLAGKFQLFQEGRSQSWKLIVIILPVLLAVTIGVSRTCDYHHHWQDVLVGSLLGTVTAYVGYRQYFPSPSVSSSHIPYALHHTMVNHH